MEESTEGLSIDPTATTTDPTATVDTLDIDPSATADTLGVDPTATTDTLGTEPTSPSGTDGKQSPKSESGHGTAPESPKASPESPKAPLSPSRTLTARDAKSPLDKAKYRLQEAMLSVPRHRDALRRAIQEGERLDFPEDALAAARVMLDEEDRKYEAYSHVRAAMASEDLQALSAAIEFGMKAGLGGEELGPAISMLSNDDFLLDRVKKFNTTLETQHKSPTARDRSKVAAKHREKLHASQSMPDLKSQGTSEPQSPSRKLPPRDRFEWTAHEEDGKLGFTPAWSSVPMVVKVVEPKTWAAKFGVKVDDEIDAVNGVPVRELDKAAIMEAFRKRPCVLAFTREKDNTEAVLQQIREHIEKTHGKKALAPKKRHPAMGWNGRVTGMSLQDYREKKWSVDACYAKVERRGGSYTMRAALPSHLGKKTGHQDLFLDVLGAYNSTLKRVPSYSCALQYHPVNSDAAPGPGEYNIAHSMDPNKHPTIPKHTGPRFGTEVLEPRDPSGPAPGDYDPNAIIHSSAIKRMPTHIIQGREAWRPRTEAPGPGVGEYVYEQAMRTGKITPIHYSMLGKGDKELKQSGINPGAPHYFQRAGQSFNPTKHKAPIWKFGSEPRGLRN